MKQQTGFPEWEEGTSNVVKNVRTEQQFIVSLSLDPQKYKQ